MHRRLFGRLSPGPRTRPCTRADGSGYLPIPLKAGIYELKLHFIERDYGQGLATGGGENSRVMDITAGRW